MVLFWKKIDLKLRLLMFISVSTHKMKSHSWTFTPISSYIKGGKKVTLTVTLSGTPAKSKYTVPTSKEDVIN